MTRPRPTLPPGPRAYETDLAYIHDTGFGDLAQASAEFFLNLQHAHQQRSGLIVDLGCGSGIQAQRLSAAGYETLGYDISPAMVALAQERVPNGTFVATSFIDAKLPRCLAVLSINEVFNYLFDRRNTLATLGKIWRRVFTSLQPDGWFLFDVALAGRVPGGHARSYAEGPDWACMYESIEKQKSLTRQITTFRRLPENNGEIFRRESETHRLRLYERNELLTLLRSIGFRVRTLSGYGMHTISPGRAVFLCRKPRTAG